MTSSELSPPLGLCAAARRPQSKPASTSPGEAAVRAVARRISNGSHRPETEWRQSALCRPEPRSSRFTETIEMAGIGAQVGRIAPCNSDDSSLDGEVESARGRTSRRKLTFESLADNRGFPFSGLRGGGFDPAAKVGRQPDRNSFLLRHVRHFTKKSDIPQSEVSSLGD
jgi:hypothetical protein